MAKLGDLWNEGILLESISLGGQTDNKANWDVTAGSQLLPSNRKSRLIKTLHALLGTRAVGFQEARFSLLVSEVIEEEAGPLVQLDD